MVCSCWPSDSSRRRTSMSKYIPGNQKHLTLEDRKYIEKSLNAGCSFKDIARYLCKDPTTISKEIRLHRLSDWYHKGCFNNARLPTNTRLWDLAPVYFWFHPIQKITPTSIIAGFFIYLKNLTQKLFSSCFHSAMVLWCYNIRGWLFYGLFLKKDK